LKSSTANVIALIRSEGVGVAVIHTASGDPEDLLSPKEAAAWLQTKVETLATWRTQNRGPAFVKVGGAVRYRRKSVLAFITGNEFANTTQADGNRR
jgi:hypothetical protein